MKEEGKKEKEQKERKLKILFGRNNNKKPFTKCLVSSKYRAKI